MSKLAVLFDLDGTLIDSIDLLLQSMEAAFAGRVRRPTRPQWVAGIGTPLRTQLREWCYSDEEVSLLVEGYRRYQDLHLEALTTLYPGVAEVVAWVREQGHQTGIVTSKGRGMTDRSLHHVGLEGLFDTIVTFEETKRHKPHPAPVELALSRLGVSPDRAIFVGDSPHDMASGRAAGVSTAAAQWGPFSREQLAPTNPSHWLSRMADLPDVVTGFDRPG